MSGAYDVKSLVNFLTKTKRGFCQQFASAMAVLVRSLGYPARVATGFTPGLYDPKQKVYRVSTTNAHTWVEVMFPGYGWIPFEPTPTRSNPSAASYLSTPGVCLAATCGPAGGGQKTGRRTGKTNQGGLHFDKQNWQPGIGKLVMQVMSHGWQHRPQGGAATDRGHEHGAAPPGAPKDHSMSGTGEGSPAKRD